MKDKAFTIWGQQAMDGITLAKSTEFSLMFGVAYFGEIWFRYCGKYLYCHLDWDKSASALMERRGD
jgi:hypothetical protein